MLDELSYEVKLLIGIVILIIIVMIIVNTMYNDRLSLDDISKQYSLDKSSNYHDYSVYYDNILSDIRNKPIKMIEIGIGTWEEGKSSMKHHWNDKNDPIKENYLPGNSLRAWKQYFHNLDYIVGIDVKKDCMFEEPNIKTELLDSTSSDNTNIIREKYGGDFDVILDDGLHEIDAQVNTFIAFWPLLKKNGIYLIEDIQDPYTLKNQLEKYVENPIHIQECGGLNKGIMNSYIIKIVNSRIAERLNK